MKATQDPIARRRIALLGLILLGLLFGSLALSRRPEAALPLLVGMGTLPAGWALLKLTGMLPGNDRPKQRLHLYDSLLGGGLVVTGALAAVAAAALGVIPEDWADRFGMLASALVLIVIGNGLPKKPEPGCTGSRTQAIQRLLGWTFVITGLIAFTIWLTLPLAVAEVTGLAVYGAAVLFAIAAIVRIRRRADSG